MYADSHCHLFMEEFDPDREAVIERARTIGVELFIVIGYSLESSRKAIQLAEAFDDMYATIGVHPHGAKDYGDEAEKLLRELAQHPKVVAIGETGLDFYRNLSPREKQEETFRRQIGLAKAIGLPLVVHDREAHDEVARILREEQAEAVGGVLHCFSGDIILAEAAWEMGFYTSIAGPITYPKKGHLPEVVRKAPIERLLLETDCPYLPPQPYRGRRNEPAYLPLTAEAVARIRGLTTSELAHLTTENTRRLFHLSFSCQRSAIGNPPYPPL